MLKLLKNIFEKEENITQDVENLEILCGLMIEAANSDGTIETADDDKVIAFVAARRGGNNIYALDLTSDVTSASDTFVPKFLWRIEGGSAFCGAVMTRSSCTS